MKKKKKYCAQRHLNKQQVILQLENDIYHFKDKAFEDIAQITYINFHPQLCRISVSRDAQGYFPHDGWSPLKNSCFQGEFIAWISDFSVFVSRDKKNMLAVYKIKNGKRLLISEDSVQIKERLYSTFYIGKHRFSYKKNGRNIMQYTTRAVR